MKNIKSFDQYIKEELFHGTAREQTGSSLLAKAGDKFFGWIGRGTGNIFDTAFKFIKDEVERQVESKEIEEDNSAVVISRTNGIITEKSIEGKSEKEIEEMILDYIEYMKKEVIPHFPKPVISEKRYYHNLQKVKK